MSFDYTYEQAHQDVLQIIQKPIPQFVHESYKTYWDVLEEIKAPAKPRDPGIQLNTWSYFNRATKGLRMNEFSIVCGPTGSGKTTLLANLAMELLMAEVGVFVASVEIGSEDFMRKMISVAAGREPDSLCDEDLIRHESLFTTTGSVFSNYDSRVSHLQLMCDIYHAHMTKGIKVALIDNLNFLMDVTDVRNQLVEMDRAVHEFVVFCKHIPVHVFMVMHPRKTDGDGRVESEFDIKGSSTAVQEASNVFLFNRVKSEDAERFGPGATSKLLREIKFAKIRKNGKSVGGKIYFKISPHSEHYSEVATQ